MAISRRSAPRSAARTARADGGRGRVVSLGSSDEILDAVGIVSELDLADVPPTSHPLDVVNVWDEDEPRDSLCSEDVFANAPAREGDLFRVPPTA